MAKDGTARGGPRPGSGRKPGSKALKELEGRADPDGPLAPLMPMGTGPVAEMEGAEMPDADDYMRAAQKDGADLRADAVYREAMGWIASRGCLSLVPPQLVRSYAMDTARWIQAETAVSEYGFLARHPTTGSAIASPYVAIAQNYQKAAASLWYQIQAIVRENAVTGYATEEEEGDPMEALLSGKKPARKRAAGKRKAEDG